MKFASAPKHTTKEDVIKGHHTGLRAKPLHGKFFVQQDNIPQVDLDRSHQWLRRANIGVCYKTINSQ